MVLGSGLFKLIICQQLIGLLLEAAQFLHQMSILCPQITLLEMIFEKERVAEGPLVKAAINRVMLI